MSANSGEDQGDIDEVNCQIGLLLTKELDNHIAEMLFDIQHALFNAGGELSIPGKEFITQGYINIIEQEIDRYNSALPELSDFILPGGNEAASICHLARSICRRTERKLVSLSETEEVNHLTLVFLNRLSDLLFVIARSLARQSGSSEMIWDKLKWDDKGNT